MICFENMNQVELDKALLEAADKGDVVALKASIAAGANVNTDVDRWSSVLGRVLLHRNLQGNRLLSDEYNECAKVLINAGADVSVLDHKGKAPLHYAAEYASIEVVEALLNNGADVNEETLERRGWSDYGMTPLFYAASRKDSAVAELLLSSGANVNHEDSRGETPLHYASDAVAPLLLNAGADVHALSIYGRTPLFMAVERRQSQAAKLLIEAGAEVNLVDYFGGNTPLLTACVGGCGDCIRLLLDAGADVNVTDDCECTALYKACWDGECDLGCVKLLVEAGADVNAGAPIIGAARCGEFDNVLYLMEKGADINVKTDDGFSPLGFAIRSGQTKIAKLLLASGARVDDLFYDGYTEMNYSVLRGAAAFCGLDLVKHLVDLGADVHAVDDEGLTPLHCYKVNKECIQFFVETCGLDVNARDLKGNTPLIYAAYESDVDCLRYLIEKGADVNAGDEKEGWSALGSALYGEDKEIIALLLQNGAAVNVSWEKGETPLHYAVKHCGSEIVKLLIDAGADVYASDEQGSTPLYIACSKQKLDAECICVLVENGVDVNLPFNADGEKPLLYAFNQNNEELVSLLVNLGAEVEAVSSELNKLLFNIVSNECRDEELLMHSIMKMCLQGQSCKNTDKEWIVPAALESQLRLLCKYGADVNYYPEKESALLFSAVVSKKAGLVKLLLELGADVHIKGEHGNSVLHYAQSLEVIKLLIEVGADVDAVNNSEETPLLKAIECKSYELVEKLISVGADVNKRGRLTPLGVASGDIRLMRLLLDAGADICSSHDDSALTVNAYTEQHTPQCETFSPPHISAKKLQEFFPDDSTLKAAFTYLLALAKKNNGYVTDDDIFTSLPIDDVDEMKAELLFNRLQEIGVEVRDESLETDSLDAFADSEDLDSLFTSLLSEPKSASKENVDLLAAIEVGDLNAVKLSVSAGADINKKDEYGYTPLYYAIRKGECDIVQKLLEAGAEVNAVCGKEKEIYPLGLAVHVNNVEMVKLLLKHGADVNFGGDGNFVPLIGAATLGHLEIAKLLIASGANVNARNWHGMRPLHAAARGENVEMVKFLLQQGGDVSARGAGATCLHLAAIGGNPEILRCLIEAGAAVNAIDYEGNTPLHVAASCNKLEIVRLLIEAGADVKARNEYDKFPVDVTKDKEIKRILIKSGTYR